MAEEKVEQNQEEIQEEKDVQGGTESPKAEDQAEQDLTKKIEELEKKSSDYWDQLLRAKAEMENIRRRAEKDLANAHKYGVEKLISELLPVIDSMELGLAAIDGDDADVAKFKEGSELTLKMFGAVMEKFDVEAINPVGEKFNPERHQAMSMQPNGEVDPNTVLTVVQKGYVLSGRVIRPAMVIVSKAETPPPGSSIDEKA